MAMGVPAVGARRCGARRSPSWHLWLHAFAAMRSSLASAPPQLGIGTLLLIFGLSGCEGDLARPGCKTHARRGAEFAEQAEAARLAGNETRSGSTVRFVVSFKGVFLEGCRGGLHRDHVRVERAQRAARRRRCSAAGHRPCIGAVAPAADRVPRTPQVPSACSEFGTFWASGRRLPPGGRARWPGRRSLLGLLGWFLLRGPIAHPAAIALPARGVGPRVREAYEALRASGSSGGLLIGDDWKIAARSARPHRRRVVRRVGVGATGRWLGAWRWPRASGTALVAREPGPAHPS